MSQSQTSGLFGHRNHSLFSDYYLDNRAGERAEWTDPASRAWAQARLADLRALWTEAAPALATANEAQTEARWVRPVLEALGHHFTVQVSLETAQGTKTPDYVLCPDRASRDRVTALTKPATDADLAGNLAVADAKGWDKPLDRTARVTTKGVSTLHEHPGIQIDTYVRFSGLDWGVLTNGRLWRLYHKESSKKLDVFYEVDLPALLEQDDPAAFNFFFLFFRPDAFRPGGWLDVVLERSQSYERGVSEGLKSQVYDALLSLAQGFLEFPGNGLDATPAQRKAIYNNSLIVLYRMLFVLYAESRKLLPVDVGAGGNATYRDEYSFQRLKQQVAQDLDSGRRAVPSMTNLWDKLRNLGHAIDQGNDDLGVPAYNGGLFNPTVHPFLEQYKVGDLHLRQAIDKLARIADPETGHPAFVDYRDLEIRHLGSIYEGLLEYQLEILDFGLAISDSSVDTSPIQNPKSRILNLVTDKGERKATGSYYTPDYIVQYIVEQTVGPVIDGLALAHADDPATLAQAVLGVNVLDPAMGSGHFLVAAAEYMARRLVELGARPPGRNTGAAEAEMDQAGELAYWRRRVVQACIYGVDLNHLAVELAKLSLWLATVAKDKPLSFLDHHLRHGNSLIGARVADLNLGGQVAKTTKQRQKARQQEQDLRAAGQISMLDDSAFVGSLRTATRYMSDIERLNSDTLADVKTAERIYLDTVRRTTQGLRDMADVWTARHFGLAVDGVTLMWLSKQLAHGVGFQVPKYLEIVDEARRIAQEHHFFHWEMEFPEVFFDDNGQVQGSAGFDAVIGNPPYVRQETLGSILKSYFQHQWASVYHGIADISIYFIELGISALRYSGKMGYITSGTFQKLNYGAPVREFLADNTTLQQVIDFSQSKVFEDATTYPVVLITEKGQSGPNEETVLFGTGSRTGIGELKSVVAPVGDAQWLFISSGLKRIIDGWAESVLLRDLLSDDIYRGITTGLNEAFVIDDHVAKRLLKDEPQSRDRIERYLRGEDLGKWWVEDSGQWIVVFPAGWTGNQYGLNLPEPQAWSKVCADYPILSQHLMEFEDAARSRYDQGDYWWELRSCSYYHVFTQPRILSTKVSLSPTFALVSAVGYSANTSYVLPIQDAQTGLFLLSVLNSTVSQYYSQNVFAPKANGYYEVQPKNLGAFPIPQIAFTTPADERARLLAQAQSLYAAALPPSPLLDFVAGLLPPHPEKSDVVHDLLAFLAERMIDLNKQRQRAEQAADPFKWLDWAVPFAKFEKVFKDDLKYAVLLADPATLDAAHDLDGLRLVPAGPGMVILEANLKLRTASDPDAWQYEDDGRAIRRAWTPIYRFGMAPDRVRYFTHALAHLGDFATGGRFPGGKSRTVRQKLAASKLPDFDPNADLTVLDELQTEIADLSARIRATDEIIDQIVYRLYGLSADEVAVVEGR